MHAEHPIESLVTRKGFRRKPRKTAVDADHADSTVQSGRRQLIPKDLLPGYELALGFGALTLAMFASGLRLHALWVTPLVGTAATVARHKIWREDEPVELTDEEILNDAPKTESAFELRSL